MRTLYNWTAKRSGARMTVTGVESPGGAHARTVAVSGVNRIAVENHLGGTRVVAYVDGGDALHLSMSLIRA